MLRVDEVFRFNECNRMWSKTGPVEETGIVESSKRGVVALELRGRVSEMCFRALISLQWSWRGCIKSAAA